jgi:hypothetical protein
MVAIISSASGKRPSLAFANMTAPSTSTSKTPPLPSINSAFTPSTFSTSAARPAARASYPHSPQYVIFIIIGYLLGLRVINLPHVGGRR